MINNTTHNRKLLRAHAREALAAYSPVMTWLLLDNDGNLSIIEEPQGQAEYVGNDTVLAQTGSFYKAHGDGAVTDDDGNAYRTQKAYLAELLGHTEFTRLFTV